MDQEADDIHNQVDEELEAEEVEEEPGGEIDPGEGEGHETPVPRQSRYNDRIHALREQARIEQERSRELEAQLRQFREEARQRESVLDERAEAERVAQMTYEERLEYNLQKAERTHRQLEQQQQFVQADLSDRATFQQLLEAVPDFKQYAPQVEVELNTLRQQRGWNVPRSLALATLIGIQTIQAAQQGLAKQREQGQKNIRRQRTAPAGGQSDVSPRREKASEKTPRDRLKDIVF